MAEAVLLIGTRKGLWVGRSDDSRRQWTLEGPQFSMQGVYSVAADTRGEVPRLFAGGTSEHWGPGVFHSDDLGRSWDEPPEGSIRFPADTGTSLERVWQIQPGPAFEPEVVYAGAEPSSLWRSADRGVTFELVRGLWDHPHRPKWEPGFGGQAIHTVIPHPDDRNRVTVAMSTGGVYRTADGGDSWAASNSGIKAYFRPDPWPEFGQCVHKVAADAGRPDRLYAQNHHGVYRSDDGGGSWQSIADGLPSDFGFPVVSHPTEPDTLYVFPLVADGNRIPVDARFRVYRSTDAGKSWDALSAGLPSGPVYAPVLRDAMCADNMPGAAAGVYVGTRDGCVYASTDSGESWNEIARHLPDVLSLRAAVI
ncbi:MAG: WD40/YVTN/BNR-like repeat-containing protein [Kribbellaceae bacterium]